MIINVPAALGLALLSEPITRLLFQRGAFHAADTMLMTPILAVYALGLPFLSFTMLALRGFYALKDTATPVRAAGLSFVVNLVLSIVLMHWFSTVGLAVASNLAVLAQAWFLQTRLSRKQPALGFTPLLPSLGKILLASVLMGAVVWGGTYFTGQLALSPKARDLIMVAGLIPAACAVYGALLWTLKIEGREEVAALLGQLRAKLQRS
ncbi:MAG: lipid II flippase MurJ, partial [bacterium]|nr:lipid II flippase MurJ [bacterium]